MRTKLFGQEVSLPFFTCPTAGNKMFHHEGEMAVARAAAKHDSLYCLSSLSTTTIEELSTVLQPQHPKLFQIYVWKVSFHLNSHYHISCILAIKKGRKCF